MYDYEQKPITTRAVVANPDGSLSFVLPRDEAIAAGLHVRPRGQTRLVGWLDDACYWPETSLGYTCTLEPESGTIDGERYGFVVKNRQPYARQTWPRPIGPSPITGFRTPAFPPSVRPLPDNAEHMVAILACIKSLDLRDTFPLWESDRRNAAISDALIERGEVTLTAMHGGMLVDGEPFRF